MIPTLKCHRATLGELTANAAAPPWNAVEPIRLSDAVTGRAPKQSTEVRALWNGTEWRLLSVVRSWGS